MFDHICQNCQLTDFIKSCHMLAQCWKNVDRMLAFFNWTLTRLESLTTLAIKLIKSWQKLAKVGKTLKTCPNRPNLCNNDVKTLHLIRSRAYVEAWSPGKKTFARSLHSIAPIGTSLTMISPRRWRSNQSDWIPDVRRNTTASKREHFEPRTL